MSFDKTGVSPGLVPEAKPGPKMIHMKCRNDSCTSIQATEITSGAAPEGSGASHQRLYQCVKCNHTWHLSVGGSVNL